MSDDEGWITDPTVIQLLADLRAIEPGDEIKIKDAEGYNIRGDLFEGKVVTVKPYPGRGYRMYEPSQEGCRYAGELVMFYFDSSWVGCVKNIAAWRRPKKETEDG